MDRLAEAVVLAIFAVLGVQMFRNNLGKKKNRSDFDYAIQVVSKEAVRRAKTEHQVPLDFAPDSNERHERCLEAFTMAI